MSGRKWFFGPGPVPNAARRGGVAEPVLRGIEGLWLLDEGVDDTAADSGGGGHDMSVQIGGYAPAWVTEGLDFDQDFIWRSGWTPDLSSGYTFSAVVQRNTALPETAPGLLMLGDGATKNDMRLTAATAIEFWPSTTAVHYWWTLVHNRKGSVVSINQVDGGELSMEDELWHVCTISHDGTNARFYLDGVLSSESPEAIAAVSSSVINTALGIGNSNDTWAGKVGIFKLNNVALTDAEIAEDLAYFKAVMGGRGVTLPFEFGEVADTRVACVYGTGIEYDSDGNLDRWLGEKGQVIAGDPVLPSSVLPDDAATVAGFVVGAMNGMRTQSLGLSQPFTIYALYRSRAGETTSISRAELAHFEHASEDVSLFVDDPALSGELLATSGGTQGSPDSSISTTGFSHRAWVRVRAIFNGASSSLKVEGTTDNGTLDAHDVAGVLDTMRSGGMFAHFQVIDRLMVDGEGDDAQIWTKLAETKALLPTYDSVIVQASDDKYRAFGNCEYDPNGTPQLVAVYRHGTDHAATLDGLGKWTKSTDHGATWSAEATFITEGGGREVRDTHIAVLSSGRWIVSYFDWDGTNDGGSRDTKTLYSDNQGSSWSSPVTLSPTTSMRWLAQSSPVIELASGDLLCATYGETTAGGAGSDRIVVVFRSTDSGASWSEDSTTSISGSDAGEPNLLLTSGGTLIMLIRHNSDTFIYRTTAQNAAATPIVWNTPASTGTKGAATPGFCELTGGDLLLCTRNHADYHDATTRFPMCLYTSSNDGVSWSGPIHPEPCERAQMYGKPIEYDDGGGADPWLFWSEESDGAVLHWRNVSDVL